MYGRSGFPESSQAYDFGVVTNLDKEDFVMPYPANVKNDSSDVVELEVLTAGMRDDADPIRTKFYPGWNCEVIKLIKKSAQQGLDLKFGR